MATHFRKQVRSMRGDLVDFSVLAEQNATQIALGNARMNAKGDIVGAGGIILKTQEQIDAEWAQRKARTQVTADIKSDVPVDQSAQPEQTAYPSIQDLVESGVLPSKKKNTQND